MNTLSRTLTGSIMVLAGAFLICLCFFLHEAQWVPLLWGIPLFIIGFFILFNRKEDHIEQRKDMKGGRRK